MKHLKITDLLDRMVYLNEQIQSYPRWGALLTALDEERRALRRNIWHRAS